MSNDATVSGTALPAFDRIHATEVETTIRELLERNRGEVKGLEAQPHPTFENTVLPLEQLSHRLSRTWSPISHLNGVLNSEELRASYNACLPLLSNYWTDLAQSEPLFRAYSAIAANEADRLDPAQRRLIERALEDFRLAGVGLPAERKARYKTVVQELAQLGAKFEENVLDAMNAWTHLVTDERELAGINPGIVDQARVRATEKGVQGWLFALEQPTYVAVMTDADSETLRRTFYEAWSTRASERGKIRQHRSDGEDPRAAPRGSEPAGFSELRGLRAGDPNGAVQSGRVRFSAPAGSCGASCRQSRICRPRKIRGSPLECLGRRLLLGEAAGQAVFHFPGRSAPLFPIAARTRRPVLGRGAIVRREDRRTPGCARVSPRRALLRDCRRQRQGARGFLPGCLRAREETCWCVD